MTEGWGAYDDEYEDEEDYYDDGYGDYDDAPNRYLEQLQAQRQELAEIEYLQEAIAQRQLENEELEQALLQQAAQEAYEEELYEDALEAQDEQEAQLGAELEQFERLAGERVAPETLDFALAVKRDDETLGEALARVTTPPDWSDPQVRREQLANEIQIDQMEREVDREDDDSELPAEMEENLDPDEAAEMSAFQAQFFDERRAFERARRPLTDEEASELTYDVLDARAAGHTAYSLHEAEQDAYHRPPDMSNPDERRHNLAEILAEEMQETGEWGHAEESNWNDRHPDDSRDD